jgi:PhzF family phenazine biosynthesis protein
VTTNRLFTVDAFAQQPFSGNPAAVCLLESGPDDRWMQALAAEMKHSETAFLRPRGPSAWDLRWFTPKVEVALCGHATLASAHVLWNEAGAPRSEALRFHTKSGVLTCRLADDRIEMDFPAKPPVEAAPPPDLARALGVTPRFVGRNQFDYLIEVESEAVVRSVVPDFAALGRIPVRGVIVTARAAAPEHDFVSRFFAPAAGVDEDPVTGSAHCCLAPFWAGRLGKQDMVGFQASARGGVVWVRIAGDRVVLGGHAVTVWSGELRER